MPWPRVAPTTAADLPSLPTFNGIRPPPRHLPADVRGRMRRAVSDDARQSAGWRRGVRVINGLMGVIVVVTVAGGAAAVAAGRVCRANSHLPDHLWAAAMGASVCGYGAVLAVVRRVMRPAGLAAVARVWFAHGICPTCGYDVRATPARCPECGAVAPTAAAH